MRPVDRTVTVSNPGNAPLVVGAPTVTGAADFTVPANTCGTVQPGTSCTLSVRFSSTATGLRTASVSIPHNAAGSPTVVSLQGTGVGAVASVTPSSITFGSVVTGTTATRGVTVSNTGNAPLVLGVPAIAGGAGLSVSANTCGTVQPGASCTVTVRFGPTTTGARAATLTLPHNAPGGSAVVALTGTGVAPAAGVSPNPVAFGAVVVSRPATRVVTVTNSGSATLVVRTPTLTGATEFSLLGSTCGTVSPGASCTVSVRFAPTVGATRSAALTIPHNAGTGRSTVTLTATGVAARFALSSTSLAFGNVAVNTNRRLNLTVPNTGTLPLTITSTTLGGANPARFTLPVNGCLNTRLAVGATCTVTVQFRPTTRVTSSGTLTVAGDATTVPQRLTVTLTGRGV